MIDILPEIQFQSTRSGGKGGQNINKVETAVIGSFNVEQSQVLSDEQKQCILQRLSNRITREGLLQVRSQIFRTQLENKQEVIRRMSHLIAQALAKKKARIATRPSKIAKQKRLESKKQHAERKSQRRKFRPNDL